MGGSSGAMYSLFFESAAVECEKAEVIDAELLGKAFGLGLDAIMKYGRAKPGDRTMVDALYPAFNSYKATLASTKSSLKAMEAATCSAEEGAKNTLTMKAAAGRASYVSASELRHSDPGAHVCKQFFNRFHEKNYFENCYFFQAIGIIFRAVFEGIKIKANEMGIN